MTTFNEPLSLDRTERREQRTAEAPSVMLANMEFIARESREHFVRARAADQQLRAEYERAEQLRKELAASDAPRATVPSKAETAARDRKQKALEKVLAKIAEGEAAKKAEPQVLSESALLTHLDGVPRQLTLVAADPFPIQIRKGETALDALNQVREAIDGRKKQYYEIGRRPPTLAEAVETALQSLPKNRPGFTLKGGFVHGNSGIDQVTLSDILSITLDVVGSERARAWLADVLAASYSFKGSVAAADRAAELAELKAAVKNLIREEVALVFAARRAGFSVRFSRLTAFNVFGAAEFERIYFCALLGVETAARTVNVEVEAAA